MFKRDRVIIEMFDELIKWFEAEAEECCKLKNKMETCKNAFSKFAEIADNRDPGEKT